MSNRGCDIELINEAFSNPKNNSVASLEEWTAGDPALSEHDDVLKASKDITALWTALVSQDIKGTARFRAWVTGVNDVRVSVCPLFPDYTI